MDIKEAHMKLIKENARLTSQVAELEHQFENLHLSVRKEVLLDVAKKLGFVHTGVIE